MKKTGILLVNLGTPNTPEPDSIKTFLAEFLSDPRVIRIPRILWWPLLHGIILRIRPKRSAKLYQKIWLKEGSPLRVYSIKLTEQLQSRLQKKFAPSSLLVALAMRYGEPSISEALTEFEQQAVERLMIIPLFPQYSASTTASIFDAITNYYQKSLNIPEIYWLRDYAEYPPYIAAIADSIRYHFQTHGQPQLLLFSFHGLPKRSVAQSNLYLQQCQSSSQRIADALALTPNQWKIAFQSRFGYAEWIEPYADQMLQALPKQGIRHIAVVCPGFAVDCLETLEEVNQQYRKIFIDAGGKTFHYIPALNDSVQQIGYLAELILQQCRAWH